MRTVTSTRRSFLKQLSVVSSLPLVVPGAVLGLNGATSPNSRIGFGVIGCGNRARAIMPNFLSFKELQFRAVSDCRADRMAGGKQMVDAAYANQDCATVPDFRELLVRKDVDAVLIATGNRWHGLGAIYAARSGKDVYAEKPVSLTVAEGRHLVETCKQYGTMYQAGTQRRSTASYQFAREMVLQGRIGKLRRVEMQVWTGPAIPHGAPVPVPSGWDYDTWLGQAPWQPFTPARVHNWQYFWDTAEGIITDMGCHYTDQVQWTLGTDNTGPVEFESTAEFPDPAKFCNDTPVTAEVRCRYANGVEAVMYQRAGFKDRYLKYIGDEGWIQVDDETDVVTAEPKSILALRSAGGAGWGDASDHVRDLIRAIQTRKQPSCHAEVAHRAISICQAWNISMRLGRKLKWDPVKEKFDDETANRMLYREPRAPWRA